MKKAIGIIASLMFVLTFSVCGMFQVFWPALAAPTEAKAQKEQTSSMAAEEETVLPVLPLRGTTEKATGTEDTSTGARTSEPGQDAPESSTESGQEGTTASDLDTVSETSAAGDPVRGGFWRKPSRKTVMIAAAVLAVSLIAIIVYFATRDKTEQSDAVQADAGSDSHNNQETNTRSSTEKGQPVYMTSVTFEPDKSAPINVVRVHNVGKRKNQEDSFGVSNIKDHTLCRAKGVMAVVADGMGGLQGGEDVSSIAVLSMLQGFSDMRYRGTNEQELDRLLRNTVTTVNKELERTVGLKKAGSTLMAVIIHDRSLSWISVGDSRTALFRGGRLTDLNRKHIFAAELDEMVRQGRITEQQAKTHPDRDKLTSYIGMGELKYTDRSVRPMQLSAGDKVILMSDGVFNTLTDSEIERILNLPIQLIGEQLERAVLQKNNPHQDNFTAVILEVPAG